MSSFNKLPPGGFNLPPGVTIKDIDGPPLTCFACGKPLDEDEAIEFNGEVYHEDCAPKETEGEIV